MNNPYKIFYTLGMSLLISACAVRPAQPTEADVLRATEMYPDITLDQLNQGLDYYKQYCTPCHKLKDPNSETVADWQKIVPAMAKKAGRAEDIADIPEDVQLSITRYLTTMTIRTVSAQ